MKPWRLFFVSLMVLLALAACSNQEELLPTPIPAPTMDESVTAVSETAPTAAPTTGPATLPPPPTLAPAATSTPLPEATSDPALAPVTLLTAEDFGTDRNPLTGELVANPEDLNRRPLVVKIPNSPPSYVRPQSGLNDADIIFEHLAEGSVTRLSAIFYSKMPEKIGPIRSARLIDLELPAMYDAALVYSGSSVGVSRRLFSSDFSDRILRSNSEGYYRSDEPEKPTEATLYVHPEGLYDELENRGLNTAPNFNQVMAFSTEPPEGGQPATNLKIDYIWEEVEWQYNAEDGRYYRYGDGDPILDGNTDEQAHTANIVIITPYHVQDPEICEQANDAGQCLAQSVQIQLWGSGGGGIVLRDGQQYPVSWHREGRNDLLTFTDPDGNPFPLKIGNTWVQLVPTWRGYENAVQITP
ncbi:MAG: DUF3048 domain-containing protein [Ardenticatenaceae bacterium]|nr:DUF3048 domain-containing protein [Ardenticatenaceae bacterium]